MRKTCKANVHGSATPVAFGRGRGKPLNVPDHPPPPGYLCYRCREKGHWIQACPTNNDPKFDGKYRVKRSTGIPRSLQTKVEKSAAMALDGSAEDLKNSGVMVNADGDFVIANPDKAAWELYQEKAKASAAAAAEAAAAEGSKELQARGLECPIDKRMFLEPTKTPCCNRTYCNDCITNALIESDFICPGCSTEGVLLDNLTVDEEAVAKIKAFEAEKAEEKRDKEKQDEIKDTIENEEPDSADTAAKPTTTAAAVSSPSIQSATSTAQNNKRPAEHEPDGDGSERPDSSASFKKQKADDDQQQQQQHTQDTQTQDTTYEDNVNNNNLPNNMMPFPMNPQMPFTNPAFPPAQGASMPFADNNFMPGAMNMMNPMMMMPMQNGFPNQGFNGWNQMAGNNFPFPANGMFGDPSMMQGNNYGQANSFNPMPMGQAGQYNPAQVGYQQQGMAINSFSNQQRSNYSYNKAAGGGRDDDSPYFRQPVNPHRHQAKQRRIRPSDYREL